MNRGYKIESPGNWPWPGTSGYVSFWYSGRVWSGLVGSGRVWSAGGGGFPVPEIKKNCKLVGKRHFKKLQGGP